MFARRAINSTEAVPVTAEADGALRAYLSALICGELQQFNRLAGGMILLRSAEIVTNATTVVKNSAGLFAGLIATGAGTGWTATVYNNTAASGDIVIPSTAVALGKFTSTFIGAGEALVCSTGITVVTAGTTPGRLYALYV